MKGSFESEKKRKSNVEQDFDRRSFQDIEINITQRLQQFKKDQIWKRKSNDIENNVKYALDMTNIDLA
jgi:hypothetical protein